MPGLPDQDFNSGLVSFSNSWKEKMSGSPNVELLLFSTSCKMCWTHTSGNRWSWNKSPFESIKSIAFEKPSRYNGVHVCVGACAYACVCVCAGVCLAGKTLMSWWVQKTHWSSVPSIVTTWWIYYFRVVGRNQFSIDILSNIEPTPIHNLVKLVLPDRLISFF